MYYYALSDIHGEKRPLEEAMDRIDLTTHSKNKILFLVDYIDRGPESCQVLYYIKELVDNYGDSIVIVLRGNHEEMFIDWLFGGDEKFWLSQDSGLKTTKSFLSEEQIEYYYVFKIEAWGKSYRKIEVLNYINFS